MQQLLFAALLFLLLACGTAVTSAVRADDAIPAQRVDGTLPVTYVDANKENTAYNPDPGASERPVQAPFYTMPEGTPPDYQSERDPIIDQVAAQMILQSWLDGTMCPTPLPGAGSFWRDGDFRPRSWML